MKKIQKNILATTMLLLSIIFVSNASLDENKPEIKNSKTETHNEKKNTKQDLKTEQKELKDTLNKDKKELQETRSVFENYKQEYKNATDTKLLATDTKSIGTEKQKENRAKLEEMRNKMENKKSEIKDKKDELKQKIEEIKQNTGVELKASLDTQGKKVAQSIKITSDVLTRMSEKGGLNPDAQAKIKTAQNTLATTITNRLNAYNAKVAALDVNKDIKVLQQDTKTLKAEAVKIQNDIKAQITAVKVLVR